MSRLHLSFYGDRYVSYLFFWQENLNSFVSKERVECCYALCMTFFYFYFSCMIHLSQIIIILSCRWWLCSSSAQCLWIHYNLKTWINVWISWSTCIRPGWFACNCRCLMILCAFQIGIAQMEAMTDEELERVGITHHGGHIALRVFCSRFHSAIIISRKMHQEALIRKHSSASWKLSWTTIQLKPSYKSQALIGNKNAKKLMRILELGWLNFNYEVRQYKQVRYKRGGGTRKILTECTSMMDDLMKVAKGLFFPEGMSVEGKEEVRAFETGGFDGCVVDFHMTVEELYTCLMAVMLRVYVMTTSVEVDLSLYDNVDSSSASPKKLLVLDSSTVSQVPDVDTQHRELPDLAV